MQFNSIQANSMYLCSWQNDGYTDFASKSTIFSLFLSIVTAFVIPQNMQFESITPSPITYVSEVPTSSILPTDVYQQPCGDNKWCYSIDFYPIPNRVTSKTINIVAQEQDSDAKFVIKFNIKDTYCNIPTITFSFEEIDFNEQYEYLTIFENDIFIKQCHGQYDGNCGKWILCLDDYSLEPDVIYPNDHYNISILQPYSIDSFCNSMHEYAINAQLTFSCSSETLSPTIEPTYQPTFQPSISPTFTPTHSSKIQCGNNEWCYYLDLYPIIGTSITQTVAIANVNEYDDTYFRIQLTPQNYDCVTPAFSIIYEDIDFQESIEYFEVYDTNNNLLTRCNGLSDRGCSIWLECVTNQTLGIDRIRLNETYTITIFEPASLDDLCSNLHPYSINLQFIISCSDASLPPSPTVPTLAHIVQQPTFAKDCGYSYVSDIAFVVDTGCKSISKQECSNQQELIAQVFSSIRDYIPNIWPLGQYSDDYGVRRYKVRVSYIEYGTNNEFEVLIAFDDRYEAEPFNTFTADYFYDKTADDLNERSKEFAEWILSRADVICSTEAINARVNAPAALENAIDNILFDRDAEIFGSLQVNRGPREILIFSNCQADDTQLDDICNKYQDPIINPTGSINVNMVNSPPANDLGNNIRNPDSYWACLTGFDVGGRIFNNEYQSPDYYKPGIVDDIQWSICDVPTLTPTSDPTIDPTADPTRDPTNDPTADPTSDPTSDPTADPTRDPTADPTKDPTIDPTSDPTREPTRVPTPSDVYDSYMDVLYILSNVSIPYIDYMATDIINATKDIREMIERGYTEHKNYFEDRWVLEYEDFWLRIESINDRIISDLANANSLSALFEFWSKNGGLKLQSSIQCSKFICGKIKNQHDKMKFESYTTILLNDYFQDNANMSERVNELEFSEVSMSDPQEINVSEISHLVEWIIGAIAIMIVLLIIWGITCYLDIQRQLIRAKTIFISNPMVISIAIGFYDNDVKTKEIKGFLKDLDGVRIDVDNALKLFGRDGLGYDIFPDNYYEQDILTYTAFWTEQKLVQYLKDRANELENNLEQYHINDKSGNRYDGLLVIISCHGLEGHVLTSDYKRVSKTAIHRIFSGKKPLSRKIPRIFLFDCCSGTNDRDPSFRSQYNMDDEMDEESSSEEEEEEQGKGTESIAINYETGKKTEVRDITRQDTMVWAIDEDNPDYRLVTIMAANEGFQSKMRTDTGSYVITGFISRLKDNIYNHKNGKFLNEVMDEIQEDLHKSGKQLLVKTFNNKTEFIKFGINEAKMSSDIHIMDSVAGMFGYGLIQTPKDRTNIMVIPDDDDNYEDNKNVLPLELAEMTTKQKGDENEDACLLNEDQVIDSSDNVGNNTTAMEMITGLQKESGNRTSNLNDDSSIWIDRT